jgi:hypothetical protein
MSANVGAFDVALADAAHAPRGTSASISFNDAERSLLEALEILDPPVSVRVRFRTYCECRGLEG